MDVIAHQAVRVERAPPQLRRIPQERQVDQTVVDVMEAVLAVVASLHDVQRNAWNYQPRVSPHAGTTSEPTTR
jgi:hypothetical protein